MLHFRSFGHIMLQESSQCLHTQTESKAVNVAISCFIWSDYGSTDKPALHRQIKTASIREEDHADKVFRHPHHGVDSGDLFCDSRLRHDRNSTLLNKRGEERHLYDSYKVSRGNEDGSPNREEPRLQTICEPCRHSIHRLVRRQLHKAGIGATAAMGLLSLRETQSVPGKLPPILRQQRPIHMDLSRAEFLECGAFSAATTGNVLPSW